MGVDIRVRVRGGGSVSQIYGKKKAMFGMYFLNHSWYLLLCSN